MTSYMPQALTDQWATPQALFDEWHAKYKFDLDPAAKKAFESELDTVLLLPVRTDTRWFHTYCKRYPITFIRGRVKFGNSKNSAPFPSMIVEMVGR